MQRLSYEFLKKLIFSHPFWIVMLTLILQLISEMDASLFGYLPNEPWKSTLSFCPKLFTREGGLTVLTYPLVQNDWMSWLIGMFVWFILAEKIASHSYKLSLIQNFFALSKYAIASSLVAISYLLPFAPYSNEHDRILGISAIVYYQLGILIIKTKFSFLLILFTASTLLYGYFSQQSTLTLWGHIIGLIIGLFFYKVVKRIIPQNHI